MIKDPDISHISRSDFDKIYEPAEDSFLLMDAVKADLPFLLPRLSRAPMCLEVGSGSGFVGAYVSSLIPNSFFYATDINPHAVAVSGETYRRNKVSLRTTR
jgi:release factor glutamine methyltransferase